MAGYYCQQCDSFSKESLVENPLKGDYICPGCFSNLARCPSCQSWIRRGEVSTPRFQISSSSESCQEICARCAPVLNSPIKNYSYTPPLAFFHEEGEEERGRTDYFGVEIETNFQEDTPINAVARIFDKNAYCWPTYDSSVGHGFEVKILPMSWKYLKNNYSEALAELWALADHPGNRTEDMDSLGMHVHMSLMNLSVKSEAFLATFFMQDLEHTESLSGRSTSDFLLWVRDMAPAMEEISISSQSKTPRNFRAALRRGYHYMPITQSRKGTIEIRFFKSTLNPEVFLERIRLLKDLKDYSRVVDLDIDEVQDFPQLVKDFVSWTDNEGRERSILCV